MQQYIDDLLAKLGLGGKSVGGYAIGTIVVLFLVFWAILKFFPKLRTKLFRGAKRTYRRTRTIYRNYRENRRYRRYERRRRRGYNY